MGLGKTKARVDLLARQNNKKVQEIWDMYFFENFYIGYQKVDTAKTSFLKVDFYCKVC